MRDAPAAAKSLHQIVDKDGSAYQATATGTVWVGYENQQFANVTSGNAVTPYFTGKDYFAALKDEIKKAEEEILIAGWQVSWDALLGDGDRLFDVLLRAVRQKKNLQIHVMAWDDSAPVQTYDDQTKSVLELINQLSGKKCVHVYLVPSLADESRKFFSHHQKQVVLDRKVAFVGGMDLAYGRYDDATFGLRADADGRQALNRYNGCIAQVGAVAKESVVDPDLLTGPIDKYANRTKLAERLQGRVWQVPYAEDSVGKQLRRANLDPVYLTIDEHRQPRMPWQDVHCRVEGPAVSDLARNFIMRWNGQDGRPTLAQAQPASAYPKNGSCQIQVLRSAPKGLRAAEYHRLPFASRELVSPPGTAQHDIAVAMENLILKAQHFIYIENQFFVSDFGEPRGYRPRPLSGPAQEADQKDGTLTPNQTTEAYLTTTWAGGDPDTATRLPRNRICQALAQRIDIAIRDRKKHPFHVIITLPVHPEGALNVGSIMTQVHWTMQSLVFGSHSLLNRIRRSIKAQQLRDKHDPNPERVFDADNDEYQSVPVKQCFQYVTLLNLRNWEKLGDRYVTEQIYVHSKTMIVDDLYAIIGSANINDRSLLGTRDSELAVLIVDEQVEKKDIRGNGKALPVRGFAHQLRRGIWRKIFGLTGNVRPATELEYAVDHPADPKSWKAIQRVARANAEAYEAVFDFIPRNKDPNVKRNNKPASIWPVWNTKDQTRDKLMPFEPAFWDTPQHHAEKVQQLNRVKGFMTTLPIEWTKGENNDFGYHTALVADKDVPEQSVPVDPADTPIYARQAPTPSDDEEVMPT